MQFNVKLHDKTCWLRTSPGSDHLQVTGAGLQSS